MRNMRLPLIAGLAMAGCSSKVADTSQYSGFLPDYSHLKPEKSASGVVTHKKVGPCPE